MDNKKVFKAPADGISPMVVAAFVLFITLICVLFYAYQRKKQARRGILLTGLCDSGKTLLYARLVHSKFVYTQTSIKENVGEYSVNGRSLNVIDIPGHERLRDKFFETHKGRARGIVYVVDSQTIQKDIRDVAEFLYNILCDPVITTNRPALIIVCNKQDQPMVKSSNAIRAMLEKEMNTLRITKSSQLESVDPKTKTAMILGDDDSPFSFDALSQFNIEFIEAYATDDDKECEIAGLQKWLALKA